ncbi:unnamed protein product [Leptidea sinapis]|uniref:Splicing factor 45 n=1 Tax=Leptidea sinapis TaxID=189913 RepID=A0A5E4QUB2_9NEOP|nr:unnamed protein product [Leptidea sinapis]
MSLYDDLDTIKARTTEKVAGWSSGIKLLQSQLQLKKAAVTQPKREATRRSNQVLTPVIDLKSKLSKPDEDESNSNSPQHQAKTLMASLNVRDFDWNVANEYDPMWPNDYEKVAKEMQAKRLQLDGNDRTDRTERKRKSRFADDDEHGKQEPSITEIMKSPSKVVLLRNMVGPGDVDEELEPEVKDECNTKYGDVIKVLIFELPNAPSDEAVRIFVEFKRIESAIKAVVDLNGRFFGGRQVKAGFYEVEKFNTLQLNE